MRFTEIGQQLRQYRLESGLRAEEIAARLGVSRAALYRYEKGEVIKLDTIKRLAELLKISPLSLLGIGVEYISRATLYFDRIRAIEESTDQILHVAGPAPYLVTSDAFDATLAEVLAEAAEAVGPERAALRAQSDQLIGILQSRKKVYQARRPSIIAIVTVTALQRFLEGGVAAGIAVSDRTRAQARAVAAAEVENIAALMEAEPIGVQLGLMQGGEPNGAFRILRSRERAYLAINPFRLEAHPAAQSGVAMITGADEALATHQKVAEALWRDALKGAAAAARVRDLVRSVRAAA
jgi:transcriptional regulator with XRE-family HTH domain